MTVPALAQERTATLVLRGEPLDLALELLIGRTGIDLSYDPPLVDGKRVYCVAEDQPAEVLLKCLLDDTGLDFFRTSSGTYVLQRISQTQPLFGRVVGVVRDAETQEPLALAHVQIMEANRGRTTNNAGRFAFAQLPPGAYHVHAQYLGYEPVSAVIEVPPNGEAQCELLLREDPVLFETLVVEDIQRKDRLRDIGEVEALLSEVQKSAPALNSLAALQALPGVRVSDATAEIHMQGGETGEHQFQLDGVPVFLPQNLARLIGPFSPFALGRINVHKAGYGAAHGSQIAGVINAQHGFVGGRTLDVQYDPLSVNARVQLPYGEGGRHGHWMAATRIGLTGLYQPAQLDSLLRDWNRIDNFLLTAFAPQTSSGSITSDQAQGFRTGLGFVDVHTAHRQQLGALRTVSTSAYYGSRTLESAQDIPLGMAAEARSQIEVGPTFSDEYQWQNALLQSTYEQVLDARTLFSVQARGSLFDLGHTFVTQDTRVGELDDGNRFSELALDLRADHERSARQFWSGGIELVRNESRFTLLGLQADNAEPIRQAGTAFRVGSFAQNEITVFPWALLTLGSRFTWLPSRETVYAEPRAALRMDTYVHGSGYAAINLSAGLYRQYVHQFDVSSRSPLSLVPSNRVWLTIDSTLAPPRATHLAGEVLYQPFEGVSLRAEGYVKRQDRIVTVDYVGRTRTEASAELAQRDFLRVAEGTSKGAALSLEVQRARGRARLAYEWSDAERQAPGLYGGQQYDVPWNEPHRAEIELDWSPVEAMTLLARWRGVWGRSWAFSQAYYEYIGAALTAPDMALAPIEQVAAMQDQLLDAGYTSERAGFVALQAWRHQLYDPEAHRLAPFVQLDLGAAYTQRIRGVGVQTRIDLLNVLDRANELERLLTTDTDFDGFINTETRYGLPFLPTFAFKVMW
ncbi:MAG: carboxypeptidase-like regulatory domain-containing protein [Rhodothermales bacterium]